MVNFWRGRFTTFTASLILGFFTVERKKDGGYDMYKKM